MEEIRNGKDLRSRGMGGCKNLEINASTVLKVGPMIQVGEVEALYLQRKRISVPSPEVYYAYRIADMGFI